MSLVFGEAVDVIMPLTERVWGWEGRKTEGVGVSLGEMDCRLSLYLLHPNVL